MIRSLSPHVSPFVRAVAVLTMGALFVSCAAVGTPGQLESALATDVNTAPEVSVPLNDPPRQGKPLVLIVMPNSEPFRDARRTLVGEIQRSFDVSTFVVTQATTTGQLKSAVDSARPTCVVLMNNRAIRLYRDYERARPAGEKPIPVVAFMASFVEVLRAALANATGIAYEVPGVTAFVHLRTVIQRNVSRVGVIHRPSFRRFIERQKDLASREKIELVALESPNDPMPSHIAGMLEGLRNRKVDAIWVLNDNALIGSSELQNGVWRELAADLNVPIIVGASNLVTPSEPLGTFAVLPDHEALGVQAANLLFDLADNDWNARDHSVELPLSTKIVLDIRQARDRFGLREGALAKVDEVVE